VKRLIYLAIALAVLGTLVVCTGCFRYFRWESQKQNPGKADALVVLGLKLTSEGKATFLLHDRVAMAKHLLDEGYAPRMILTGGNPENGITEAAKMKQIALRLGVPEERIVLEPNASSTVENAEYSAELLRERGYRSALVVSDAAHLGYAVPVFRDYFEERKLALYWLPVDYDLLTELGTARHPGDAPE
jgi:uncharacterized SAM-binding protein YcdF (DUF218 family)